MEDNFWEPWKNERTAKTHFILISLNGVLGGLGLLMFLYKYCTEKTIETPDLKSDIQENGKPFKVMELPLVALRHVADFWDPNEQYQLSKTSKKSKEIIKSIIKKRPSQLILAVPSRVVLAYSATESFNFDVPFYRDNMLELEGYEGVLPEFPDDCFQIINDLKDLFGSVFKRFAFFPTWISWEGLYRIVDLINLDESLPIIPAITMNTIRNNRMFLKILLENLEKNVQSFTIREMERSQKSLKIHHNFEIEDLYVENTLSLDINAFTSLKFSRAYLYNVNIASEEINEILMSWKMGRFGDKMELFYSKDVEVMDLRIILSGLEAELKDPRTTKRSTIMEENPLKPWQDERAAMAQFIFLGLNAFMGGLFLVATLYNYYKDEKEVEELLEEDETDSDISCSKANGNVVKPFKVMELPLVAFQQVADFWDPNEQKANGNVTKPFKVMDLPHVAFQQVADFWDPNEQYQLAKTSKKSKEIIKSVIKKRPSDLILAPPSKIVLEYSDTESFNFRVPIYRNQFYKDYTPGDHPRFSLRFPDDCFKMINDLKELFDSEFKRFAFSPNYLSWEDLYRIVDWINRDESLPIIPVITMNTIKNNGMFLKILMENLEKNVQSFLIWGMERGQKNLKIRHNSEIGDIVVKDTLSFDLDAFTSLKFSGAYLYNVDIQSEEINEILMSWKIGRFGDKMELFYAEDIKVIDLRTMLNGLEAELRDPRTVKRNTTLADGSPGWLCGGIDVTGVNGMTATIWLYSYQSTNEDDPIPEDIVQKYEEAQRNWNRIAGDDGDPVRDAIVVDTHLNITFE